jgi:hypothetical protein
MNPNFGPNTARSMLDHHDMCVRVKYGYCTEEQTSLWSMCKWLRLNVKGWDNTFLIDVHDSLIFINGVRQVQLFALTWSQEVVQVYTKDDQGIWN